MDRYLKKKYIDRCMYIYNVYIESKIDRDRDIRLKAK